MLSRFVVVNVAVENIKLNRNHALVVNVSMRFLRYMNLGFVFAMELRCTSTRSFNFCTFGNGLCWEGGGAGL